MRIFLSCQQAQQKHAIPAYSFWGPYFKQGLEEAGHEWVEGEGLDWVELLANDDPNFKRRTWERAVEQIGRLHRERPIDMFLGYFFPGQVDPDGVRQVRDLGIPCVNFFCDNVREFTRVPAEFAPFDLHWVPEYKALALYRRARLEHVYAPMPVWIPPEQRTCNHPEAFGVTFIGSWDLQRDALFWRAIKLGAPIDLRGPGWDVTVQVASERPASAPAGVRLQRQLRLALDQGLWSPIWKMTYRWQRGHRDSLPKDRIQPAVFGPDYVAVTQQSAIILGVNRYPSFRRPFWLPDTYSRLRDIEAPMMGACYLTEWTEGLDDLYDLKNEIATYRDADDLVEQIQRLMRDEPYRRSLRERGQRRALSDHTVGRSVAKIAEALGLRVQQRRQPSGASQA